MTLWTCVLISDAIIPDNIFLGILFCDFDFSFVFTKISCFLYALFDNVTSFCSLELKKTIKNPLQKIQVCNKFISIIMENNLSHKFVESSTFYDVAMKGLKLSSRKFFWNPPVYFDVVKCHLQLQFIYPFPPVSLVQSLKSLVPWDKLHLGLKSNWSVACCLQYLF